MTTEDHCWWGKFVVLFWERERKAEGDMLLWFYAWHQIKDVRFSSALSALGLTDTGHREGYAACTFDANAQNACLNHKTLYDFECDSQEFHSPKDGRKLCWQTYCIFTYWWEGLASVCCQAVLCYTSTCEKIKSRKLWTHAAEPDKNFNISIQTVIDWMWLASCKGTWAFNASA